MLKVSVVIASKVGAPFIDHCLQSLENQARECHAEVLVVVPAGALFATRIAAEYPWTRIINAVDTTVPALRRRGVDEAEGNVVAVIEEHCSAKSDWLKQAIDALERDDVTAVGGPIVDYDYPALSDWVVYFCEYSDALPPFPPGEAQELNDANIAYRRSVLTEHREQLDAGYWPMTLHGALRAEGHSLRSIPEMVVYHRGPFRFGYYLGQRYLFSRAYTGVRAQSQPVLWRLTYLAAGPVMPLILLARKTRTVFAKRCRVKQFVLALPLTLIALVVFVAGEWVGCLLGPGDALSRVE